MDRRNFMRWTAGGTIYAALCTVPGEAATRVPRVGVVSGLEPSAAADFLNALREGLAGYGYVEPRTLQLEVAYANNDPAKLRGLVDDMQRRGVDLIVTHGAATAIVVNTRPRVPVIYETSADPVSSDLARDLAHPMLNATGITLMAAELNSKRVELLHAIAPSLRRLTILANPLHPGQQLELDAAEAAARPFGIEVTFHATPDQPGLDSALDAVAARPPDALLLFSDGFIVDRRKPILDFAMMRRIPVASGWAVMARSGALFTYGPRLVESYRRTAYFVDRVLRGTRTAELPIEQPTILELVLNLRTARALAMTIPATVLARADTVIE